MPYSLWLFFCFLFTRKFPVLSQLNPLFSVFFYFLGNAFFTFTLDVYEDENFAIAASSPIALDQTLYLKALVVTQSDAPNLDLFPVSCWASSSDKETSYDNKVTLIENG